MKFVTVKEALKTVGLKNDKRAAHSFRQQIRRLSGDDEQYTKKDGKKRLVSLDYAKRWAKYYVPRSEATDPLTRTAERLEVSVEELVKFLDTLNTLPPIEKSASESPVLVANDNEDESNEG